MKTALVTAIFATTLLNPTEAMAEASAKTANVSVRLVPEVTAIQAGKPFTVAVHFKIAPKWHTYWKNAGDAGMPTKVVWTLPDSFKTGELQWPTPIRTVDAGLALYGYDDEVTLLTEITPLPSLPVGNFTIAAALSWLECSDVCIPGKAKLNLTLPAADARAAPAIDSREKALFAAARASMPRAMPTLKATHAAKADQLVLSIRGATGLTAPIEFVPETGGLIEPAANQTVTGAGPAWSVSMKRPANPEAPPGSIKGVLVSGSGATRKAYSLISIAAVGAAPRSVK
ncbi:MAG: protein-disulfide reductase DsbD domain-containing protein [Vicinamibacteria bacterium]